MSRINSVGFTNFYPRVDSRQRFGNTVPVVSPVISAEKQQNENAQVQSGAKSSSVLNWFNEGMTNVSNAMKGKNIRVPKNVVYTDSKFLGKDVIAGVIPDATKLPENKKHLIGFFGINKDIMGNIDAELNHKIDKVLPNIGLKAGVDKEGKVTLTKSPYYLDEFLQKMVNSISHFRQGKYSYNQKVGFNNYIKELYHMFEKIHEYPEDFIQHIMDDKKIIKS